MARRVVKKRLLELIKAKERKLGRRIKQHDIAMFAKVSDHTIINWLRNDIRRYDAEMITALCDYFDVGICDLLYFEEIEVDDPDL